MNERKIYSYPAEFKADPSDSNIVEGYASMFGNVDSYGDVVVKGAFKKTIKERVNGGLVPFVSDHEWSVNALLGTITKASEDNTGLHFTAKLSEAQSVQDVKQKMIEGHLKQTSFSFRTIAQEFPKDGTPEAVIDNTPVYRYLKEVSLLDIAPVVIAANERAHITSVKSLVSQIQLGEIDEKELTDVIEEMLKLTDLDAKTLINEILRKADESSKDITSSDSAEPGNPLTDAILADAQALELEIAIANFNLE